MSAVISMLIGSVKNHWEQSHTSKMDQLYSHWCQKPTPITLTESQPKQTTAPVQKMMITTDKTEGEKNADPKSEVENGRNEEVQEIVAICAPIISVSTLLILFVLLFHTVCKRAGSSAPLQKIQILPVTSAEGELYYHDGSKGKNLATQSCVYHP